MTMFLFFPPSPAFLLSFSVSFLLLLLRMALILAVCQDNIEHERCEMHKHELRVSDHAQKEGRRNTSGIQNHHFSSIRPLIFALRSFLCVRRNNDSDRYTISHTRARARGGFD